MGRLVVSYLSQFISDGNVFRIELDQNVLVRDESLVLDHMGLLIRYDVGLAASWCWPDVEVDTASTIVSTLPASPWFNPDSQHP